MKYEIFTCPFLNNVVVPSAFLVVFYPVMITFFYRVFENVFTGHFNHNKFKSKTISRRHSCPHIVYQGNTTTNERTKEWVKL